ncbi:hypothetical protein HRI_000001200 [Hibiscus trionum]|uniref:WRC domain-containing protein n=1 Tax=Hibiscus trionum TaxID=183268 RepID=A0A9W7LGN4_HIBTR|nr:hypothetical protein HRI_000001200 [Hibiscus trionum]
MRIRKRQVPLPFSSISPVPLSSDPNFNRPPVAVVQLPLRQQQQPPPPHTTPCCFDPHHPSKSDHPNHSIGQPLPTQALDSTAFHGTTAHIGEQLMKTKQDYLVLEPGEGGEEEEGKRNDTGKKSVLGEELGTGFVSQSSSSRHQGVGRWGEGEKHAYNKRAVKSNVGKMKTKLNKKLVQQGQGTNNEQQVMNESSGVDVDNPIPSGAKKRGRGGALMEGSRCSRVNGRGWRCCQQTLIGYSLCEHHLGKGRLRSITSVRSRAKEVREANNAADKQALVLSNSSSLSQQLRKQTKGECGEDGKPLMIAQKRVKLGMVKARSISSLLGQDDNAIAVADDNN